MTPARALDRRPRGLPKRLATLGVAISLLACSPAPTSTPAGSATPLATVAATLPTATGIAAVEPALAAELRDGLDAAAILEDLQRLQEIALANEGHRAAGSDSEAAAAQYVADELRAAGFAVELQDVPVPWFSQDAPSVLEVEAGAVPLEDLRDFKAMLLSPSGDVRGPIHELAFNPAAPPGDRSGLGCAPTDFAAVPAGAIVLTRPGPCFRRDVVEHAQEAGAVALITAYPEWQRDMVLRPTLVDPDGLTIPVIAASNDAGLELLEAAQRGATGHVAVHSTIEKRTGVNVIAESAGGAEDHVLYIGGHLDAAVDGPGINDDGSGTMTILEIGRQLGAATSGPQSAARDGWKVVIGFWTGEEIGLFGSAAYVDGLDPAAIGSAEAYLNFDMLGSPNGVRLVYGGSQTTRPTESQAVAALFSSAFDRAGLTSTVLELGGASDHVPFNNIAIPTGGLFSGANEAKTPEQAALFGGTAGAPNDPCYHLVCDTTDNIDPVLLEEMARAGAWVVGALASGEVTLRAS